MCFGVYTHVILQNFIMEVINAHDRQFKQRKGIEKISCPAPSPKGSCSCQFPMHPVPITSGIHNT